MEAPLTDRRAVETAVVSLQTHLADGDPADAALRSHCEAVLLALRAAYRVNPADFSREAIEVLRELSELLRETDPAAHVDTPGSTEPHERRPPGPPASHPSEEASWASAPRDTGRDQKISTFQRKTSKMTDDPKPTDRPDHEPPKRLSQKEFAKKMRREAYLRAKEYRKTDPRQIAMKEKLKQQRRDADQKVKERGKVRKAERKKAADEKATEDRVAEGQSMLATLAPASTLKPGAKRTS